MNMKFFVSLSIFFSISFSSPAFAKDVPLLKNIEGFEYVITKPHYTIKFMWPDSEEHEALLRAAVTEWNHAARDDGFITFAAPGEDADITIMVLNYDEGTTVGLAIPFSSNQCTILIKTNHSLNPMVYLHELGHCLGFAHTEDRKEIMFPTLQENNYSIGKATGKKLRTLIK